jgi:hypothetical protein
VVLRWLSGVFWLLSTGGWAPVGMGWIAGFLRAFRRVCRRLFCGGLCMSFIRCAYLHTASSVLVHRATVSVGLAICGYACVARAVCACCLRFPVVCVVCVSACWISNVVCLVCVVRFPTIARACHAACDAHLVPTIRALHHRVPRSYKRAHVPGRVGGVCCVPRNTHFPRADFFLLMQNERSAQLNFISPW